MNSRKRNKLKAKRTPWIKSRYSRKARAIRSVMQVSTIAAGVAVARCIQFSSRREGKSSALFECVKLTTSAAEQVPLYGSKTV